MIIFKILFLLFFTLLSIFQVFAETYNIPIDRRGQKIEIMSSKSIQLDKISNIQVSLEASPGNTSGYLYPGAAIYVNGNLISSQWGEPTYNNPCILTFQNVPIGLVTVKLIFQYPASVTSVKHDFVVTLSCPSLPDVCSSLTCPYCTTTYCSTHTLHYTATHTSAYCKVSMHSFCTDNQSAYNAYQQAISSATNLCSTCSSMFCKICGHTCGNSSCPSLPDCSSTSCSVCKSSYCSTHGLHICTAVGNASNGSSGPWNVWTQQNGTNITVNVEADFHELVQAQQNANVLLQNIDNTIKGFITQQDEFNKSINNHLSQTNDNISKLIESAGYIDDNVILIKEFLSEFRHEIYPDLDYLFREIKSNSQTLIDALYSNSAEIINNQNNLYTLLSGPLKFDFSSLLSPLN